MESGRLRSDFWVAAQVRRLDREAIPTVVVRRGDPVGGTVLVKVNQLDMGCRVLSQIWDGEGRPCWMAGLQGNLVCETEADAYIARAVMRDPDLWVIEIEDRAGRHALDGR
ncbi:MAG: DUF1491 family protein, partial [Alphaproteobacteria bacterium]|nr:DUF1491 family protein [Alphaproteobacteria bacterium]